MDPPQPKFRTIQTRPDITSKYKIINRVGSGSYADVYRGHRLSDETTVALKEVHDQQSAFREIEALRILQGSRNVVVMHEFFCCEDEDVVIVLEFLRSDLVTVMKESDNGEMGIGKVKSLMMQILCGVDACHRNMILHRDLKPSNFLISDDGVLKLADFGQARILMEPGFDATEENPAPPYELDSSTTETLLRHSEAFPEPEDLNQTGYGGNQEHGTTNHEEYFRVLDELKTKSYMYDTDKDTIICDGNNSCLATCTTNDTDDEIWKDTFTYEADEGGNELGCLTSCIGSRWYKAPELLYGSTDYGLEVDLWSLGCIFSELLTLKPLFPGTSDIDQLSRIISVMGNLNEESWPDCSKLPDYTRISFSKVENPTGLETCLQDRSADEVSLVKKLLFYDPSKRATAMELLHDKYFNE
ncbi:putative protein-serine/threonine kinase CMGC-CDK-CCRK family [Lupinus albus]|uniref:cyclin-dependent kinase n=1 Tax=Lupinus albus TaxID=3870 RepID=A0A6A4NEX0_LUPAL|nr:putative protein-serine/threonine kinase CMGC-CDK-CCRK family [Lupinus albus]